MDWLDPDRPQPAIKPSRKQHPFSDLSLGLRKKPGQQILILSGKANQERLAEAIRLQPGIIGNFR
jgi:hypothetical protein